MDLSAIVGGDDWKRLLGGWRDIADDTDRLVRALRAVPDSCGCGDGQAHLRGMCSCCGGDAAARAPCDDCFRLVRTIGWKLDVVVDDALRYLDPVAEVLTTHVGSSAFAESRRLRHELLRFVGAFRAVEAAAGRFRQECRASQLTQLKALGEGLDKCIQDLDVLVDPTRGFARARSAR